MKPRSLGRSALTSVAVTLLLVVAPSARPVTGATGAWSGAGPVGGSVDDLEVDPVDHDTVWAAAVDGLVFRSTDGGRHWARRHAGIPGRVAIQQVGVAPSDPSVVYAGGYAHPDLASVMYRTTNGGASWSPRGRGLGGDIVLALAVHPTDPNTAYAATYHQVYKTTNGGQDWDPANNGIDGQTTYALLIRPGNPNVAFAGTGNGVYRTTNGGMSWSPRGTDDLDQAISSIVIDPFDPSRLYAGTYGSFVYETLDGGANWAPLGTGLPYDFVDEVEVDPSMAKLYAMVRDNGIYTLDTNDPSAVWTPANTGIAEPGDFWTIAVDPVAPTNVFAGGHGPGVARSTDRAASRSRANRGLNATIITAIDFDPTQPSIVYAADPWTGDVYRSTDAASSWQRRSNGLPEASIESLVVSPSDPMTLYAGLNGPGVYKSTDGGATWLATTMSDTAFAMVIHPTDPDTVWIGTIFDGIFKTTDGGGQWDPANTGLPDEGGGHYPFADSLMISESDPDVLYMGSYQQAFTTVDGAGTWTEVSNGLQTTSTVVALAIHPTDTDVVYAGINDHGVYRTKTGGASWTQRGLAGRDVLALAIDPARPKTVYAGALPSGIYRSLDAGATWAPFATGLRARTVTSLAIGPNGVRLYAATQGGGVWTYRYP